MKLTYCILVTLGCLLVTQAAKQKAPKNTVTETEEEIVVKDGPVEKTYKVSKEEKSKDQEYNVKRCPAGWYRYHNDKCFKFFAAQLSQDDAELSCQSQGSTLASLSSEAERHFLKSLVLKESGDEATLDKLWLGLRRKANELYNFDLSAVSADLAYVTGHPETGTGNCASLACDADTLTTGPG
ncbi:hypothetical protein HDE_13241 [Halotydeus destructor]|nr:hypothetical protein HDE_13241 [Halotydeus destructor]